MQVPIVQVPWWWSCSFRSLNGFSASTQRLPPRPPQMGVHPSRIIFAHPCKRASDIRFARDHGVQYTTFDTVGDFSLGGGVGVRC